jgi:hypothetical protein
MRITTGLKVAPCTRAASLLPLKVLAATLVLAALVATSRGQQSSPSSNPSQADKPMVSVTVTGTVAQFDFNSFYQAESVRLSTGEVVSFPVDMGCALASGQIKVGDIITVAGEQFVASSGTKTIRAEAVTNNSTRQTLRTENPDRVSLNLTGRVAQLNYQQDGQVNGLVLGTGELILWKPRPDLNLNLEPGSRVTLTGISQVEPNEKRIVAAQTINGIAVNSIVPPRRMPVDLPPLAVITNTGSTNTAGYRISVTRSGQATVSRGDQHTTGQIPFALAQKFFADLVAARPLGRLYVQACPKSASFGTSTYAGYGGQQTPDLTCPGDARVRALHDDVAAISQALNVNPIFRR